MTIVSKYVCGTYHSMKTSSNEYFDVDCNDVNRRQERLKIEFALSIMTEISFQYFEYTVISDCGVKIFFTICNFLLSKRFPFRPLFLYFFSLVEKLILNIHPGKFVVAL